MSATRHPTFGGITRTNRLLVALALGGAMAVGACGGEGADEGLEVAGEPAAGSVGAVGEGGDFGTMDANRDARLTSDEFGGYWRDRGLFSRWNTQADAGLDQNEFGRGVFGVLDRNEEGLTETEWNEGTRGWFEGGSAGAFGDWDLNDNNLVEENEFSQGVQQNNLFGAWDANRNNTVEEEEWNNGLFNVFDTDNDQGIAENEWRTGSEGWDWGF